MSRKSEVLELIKPAIEILNAEGSSYFRERKVTIGRIVNTKFTCQVSPVRFGIRVVLGGDIPKRQMIFEFQAIIPDPTIPDQDADVKIELLGAFPHTGDLIHGVQGQEGAKPPDTANRHLLPFRVGVAFDAPPVTPEHFRDHLQIHRKDLSPEERRKIKEYVARSAVV